MKIKKGDTVQVISGSDKGKKGTVIEVKPSALKIKIQGVKVQTHYDKKDGLLKKEGFIESRGGDFYSLTDRGKQEVAKLAESSSSAS